MKAHHSPLFWKAYLSIKQPLTAHGPIHLKVSSRPESFPPRALRAPARGRRGLGGGQCNQPRRRRRGGPGSHGPRCRRLGDNASCRPAAVSAGQPALTRPESLPSGPGLAVAAGGRGPGLPGAGPPLGSHGGAAAGKARRKLKLSPMKRTQVAAHSDTTSTQLEEPD